MTTYRTIIIGAGLMGSAAARHLSLLEDGVAVIGPPEPAEQSVHQGVFASHYDQGRLTTLLSSNASWSRVARHAIDGYQALEESSGIDFYRPVGRLMVESAVTSPPRQSPVIQLGAAEQVKTTLYSAGQNEWRQEFPYLEFPNSFWILHEPKPAGYINPRSLIRAQLTVAERQGATIIRTSVGNVREESDGVTVDGANGEHLHADRVLVAAGAFSNFNNLLPDSIPLKVKTETIVLGKVSAETARALHAMPVITYSIEDDSIDDIYMAPPIQYPDGCTYIKLGCNTRADQWPATLSEVGAWFRNGDSDVCKPAMSAALRSILPGVRFESIVSKRCIVCYTPSGLPTIDAVSPRCTVLTGGNGSGAKGSDTLGELAAGLVHDGRWPDEIDRKPFRLSDR